MILADVLGIFKDEHNSERNIINASPYWDGHAEDGFAAQCVYRTYYVFNRQCCGTYSVQEISLTVDSSLVLLFSYNTRLNL